MTQRDPLGRTPPKVISTTTGTTPLNMSAFTNGSQAACMAWQAGEYRKALGSKAVLSVRPTDKNVDSPLGPGPGPFSMESPMAVAALMAANQLLQVSQVRQPTYLCTLNMTRGKAPRASDLSSLMDQLAIQDPTYPPMPSPADATQTLAITRSMGLEASNVSCECLPGGARPACSSLVDTFIFSGLRISGRIGVDVLADPKLELDGLNIAHRISLLDLSSTQLQGELLPSFNISKPIFTLNLSCNRISGTIPPSLPISATIIDLRSNQLTGILPSALFRMPSPGRTVFLENAAGYTAYTGENGIKAVWPTWDRHLLGHYRPDDAMYYYACPLPSIILRNNSLVGTLPESWTYAADEAAPYLYK